MKTASRIFLTFSLLAFFAGMTFAQVVSTTTPAKASTTTSAAAPGKSVNSNTGTCDKHEAKGASCQGKNFVDKNGDGKCDNCGTAGKCKEAGNCGTKGQCSGKECGKSQGKGNCCGQGHQQGNGCSNHGSTPAAEPKK